MKIEKQLRQQLQRKQTLHITQEMKDALFILKLPILELTNWVTEQWSENPALEWEDISFCEHLEVFNRERGPIYHGNHNGFKDKNNIELLAKRFQKDKAEIIESITRQCDDFFETQQEQTIAYSIIKNIDSNGFLSLPITQIAEETNADIAQIEAVRKKILSFEPCGIASKNLQEFLLIQLEDQQKRATLSYRIIAQHFTLLKDLAKISKILKVSVKKIIDSLRKDIKPLLRSPLLSEDLSPQILSFPDIIIEKEEKKWKIFVNEKPLPSIKINPLFLNEAKNDPSSQSLLRQAKFLIHSLAKRNTILTKIAYFLFKEQKLFFENRGQLRPITLTVMAKDLHIHLSTASRAISQKTLLCPQGLFPMKFFFSSSHISSHTNYSHQTALALIKKIIKEENKRSPHSDEVLNELLKNHSIICSRRTVSKYRKKLGLASRWKRKICS